ncbi:glutamate synthase large subunit [Mariniblastus fucicola]|uniref:Glutamate synthase [NADPH] large chain n=1 Tax=Mariniblastus fucicola TaxID=980251 RepID=A0A5B9P7X9_9BACT|nr:glutamate synthase large subunit [Mariniblastus fucicola]QEG22398.1 Ferredoxin-dependent glutamate synthase 1 [Mariniblastus fucicola]
MNNDYVKYASENTLYAADYEHDSCGVGFVAHLEGVPSRAIVVDACEILARMEHRGACGCEAETGDGAGISVGMPESFMREAAQINYFELDCPFFGVGNVFLPTDERSRERAKRMFQDMTATYGQTFVGWRELPVDPSGANIGATAIRQQPKILQAFIAPTEGIDQDEFERKLYLIRKRVSHDIREAGFDTQQLFYVCSLSSRILVYKGMLSTAQLPLYYPDLQQDSFESHLAMVHSRFSTNTLPAWSRAQPLRWMAHNGEINTLRGNRNWITARQGLMNSELFGDCLEELKPIIEQNGSDSAEFDNAMELLMMAGRGLPEVVMMMIPEAWRNHRSMPENKRAFYEYHACLQEPWDGPASISFTDGQVVGAVLDRNGLRPSRYYVTDDNRVLMASEVGVLDIDPATVVKKGRLEPGKMFLVDFENGRIVADEELKENIANRLPYGEWLKNQRLTFDDLPAAEPVPMLSEKERLAQMRAFGYSSETMDFMLLPMIKVEKDPIGSMGNDMALACLSDKPRLLYDYFTQLFAQVTNPPIDSIREEIVMSVECFIGPEGNLLDSTEKQCNRLVLHNPILDFEQMAKLSSLNHQGWTSRKIDITFDASEGEAGFLAALDRIRGESEQAIEDGCAIVILSDRGVSADRIPLSALLATSAVHHHLIEKHKRTRIGIVVETGEAREVHHHCLLTGFGADGIHPYLGLEAIIQHHAHNENSDLTADQCIAAYRKGVMKGMLKVLAKMGISTLASYKGARIFEAIGLNTDVIHSAFPGTASRIEGVGFDVLAAEAIRRHKLGYRKDGQLPIVDLETAGTMHWRHDGEKHAWTPLNIADIQTAARKGDVNAYKRFAKSVNEHTARQCHLRGLLTFKEEDRSPIPIEEVEPAKDIVKRFCTGAMSFGSISAESHETLAVAMNRLGGKSNTGEGGEDYKRFGVQPNGDSKRSAIKQVASGRFGVTAYYLANADEIQIKMAQGAKPGEGGELPGHKVDETIAQTRRSTPGVTLISPPPHHDIYSIEDLAQLIYDLKNSNPSARISVKLVSEVGVGTIAAGVAKAHADNILISGCGGGTGASPITSIKHAGMPWELGIAETHQTLVMNDLRSRVRLQTDGQLKTGRDIVIATLLGAEEYGFATAPLITLGCIMMRKCHLNTCPVGIATQDPELRKKFKGKPEHVVNYLFMVAQEAREIMASLGFRSINEMVGRVDKLDVRQAVDHWKAQGIDLSKILAPAMGPYPDVDVHCTIDQDHALDEVLDWQFVEQAKPALTKKQKVAIDLPVRNIDRAAGTILSHHVVKAHGPEGLPDDTIEINLTGSAGQSLGAFLARGVSITVEGDANDYVGKGLSGGRIVVRPPKSSKFVAEENIIIGNVALYGATEGKAFFRGIAAERFAVRNSGACAVIEGIGDHGLEYMTGGRAVILGPTGRNFAAGMSGGFAFVYDPQDQLLQNINLEMVDLEPMEKPEDISELKSLIEEHLQYTESPVAQRLLNDWENALSDFRKVIPIRYREILKERAEAAKASRRG